MTEDELQTIELVAARLARSAGMLLLDYFNRPLEIKFKSPDRRNPVTEADRASDAHIRAEIAHRYPGHGILSEEAAHEDSLRTRVTWIVDPLDGTNNFMNGLPLFGVSIAVFEGDRPVVGALFVPTIESRNGVVLHAREGGGAKRDGEPVLLAPGTGPGNGLLAGVPSYFYRAFGFSRSLRPRLGETRSTGSTAYELAMLCSGVFNYLVFARPHIWDVAAGLLLVREAGGAVLVRSGQDWRPFERVDVAGREATPSHGELKSYHRFMVLGQASSATLVAEGLRIPSYRFPRLWRRVRRRVRGG